ncbi:MAG: phosphonate metabolism transcriptional regulator PhnF [Pseudomonadota bacterium]
MTRDSWTRIKDAIERDIDDGVLAPGARLPTEPELKDLYGTGRHSVRRALAELARDGRLSIEQGRGTFVLPQPKIEYIVGRRTRLHKNLAAQGIDVASESLGSERIPAPPRVVQALGLGDAAKVLVTRRLTRADGVPVSYGALYHDTARFPDFPERRTVLGSVSAVYRSYGIEDYLRGTTTMHARPAKPEEARQLRQHPNMPVMLVRAVDTLPDGTPIAYGEVIWSATRVRFTFAPDREGADDGA